MAFGNFVPSTSPTLLEPWRWKELEPLDGFSMTCGAESEAGTLWFGRQGSVLSYDGYEVEEWSLPDDFGNASVFQLYPESDSSVYVYTSEGILYLDGDGWTRLARFKVDHPLQVRDFMVRNSHGVMYACIPSSIVRIENGRLYLALALSEPSHSYTIDASDRIWFVEESEGRLVSYQTDESGNLSKSKRRVYELGEGEDLDGIHLIGSVHSDEVWAVSRRPGVLPNVYSSSTQLWEKRDLSALTGNNAHAAGRRLSEDILFIESKTRLLLRQGGQWIELEVPGVKLPISSVFTFSRRNGNLIIGGQGEPTYEVELSGDHWASYEQLNFHCETSNQHQWFISFEGAILEFDPVKGEWLTHLDGVLDTPVGMLRTSDDTVWAYGSHGGIPAVSLFDGHSWRLDELSDLESFVGYMSATELRDGRVLFGSGPASSSSGRGGLIVYEKDGSGYRSRHIPRTIAPARPVSLAEGKDGAVWMSGSSLVALNASLEASIPVEQPPNPDEWIDHVASDHEGAVWVANWTEGLFRKEEDGWAKILAPDDIASDHVAYVHPDAIRTNQIWVATNRGISRFDGKNWIPESLPESISFRREGGTLRQSMNGDVWINRGPRSWYFRTSENKMIPERIASSFTTIRYRPDQTPPRVRIESFDNNTTRPSSIHVRWKGLDKWSDTPQSDLRYSYRFGENDWSAFSTETNATFVDTASGEHLFQVRVIDRDGNVSTAPAEALITVQPPYWQRTWFLVGVLGSLLTIVLLIALLIRQGIRHVLKIEEFKIQFFTNISHELRTPLTVILAPLERLLDKGKTKEEKSDLELAHRNARKMQLLIDQLLDFRSAEQGPIVINRSEFDFIRCVDEAVRLIEPLAKEKSQEIQQVRSTDSYEASFDLEKVETILSNLISNAIKYTQENGYIRVEAAISEGEYEPIATVTIEDNGPGIQKGDLERIWETFYRGQNTADSGTRGSGIGLAYAKALVEAHGGSISVESPVNEVDGKMRGTRFQVSIPLQTVSDEERAKVGEESHAFEASEDTPRILIIEDDDDIRSFLANELRKTFVVKEASDGVEGWRIAQEMIPDLIVCDVMMPHKDGREVCRLVKSADSTSHIPVFLLTALNSETHEMAGLESGADDYIAKPVNLGILKQRIHNLISSRKKIHERYAKLSPEAKIEAKELTGNPQEEAFLAKALKTVEENADNTELDVEYLASQMGMSRMSLYRKFKAMTGESPGNFIRSVRMKKAAGLLAGHSLNVSQISDSVGFSDISQFSKSFKKYFGESPSQYRERVRG
ncbi:hybrid sensor histidine kinase/response regulator transcription factor [Pelagicoccus mobilis]|uniref:histidine kinase n=1 Tax=Pelagicoccus mobilis TaxID=415221 RepID=A0A934VPW6_9BACT|nr:ATP-binding protein [Pelagicoccus mobilis]MBK1875929.1 helix-turn-helix domain-containing protein [Pelagicoccus mobilis]